LTQRTRRQRLNPVVAYPTLPLLPKTVATPKPNPAIPEDDDEDDSDLDSEVSDISSGIVEEEIEAMKQQMPANPFSYLTQQPKAMILNQVGMLSWLLD
jgi:hypothetical protein